MHTSSDKELLLRTDLPVYIVNDAIPDFIVFCREREFSRFLLVADTNTYPVLGQRAEAALRDEGWDVRTAILEGEDVEGIPTIDHAMVSGFSAAREAAALLAA